MLTVTVSDEGAWRIADGENKKVSRGRGIPLMQALADRATIDSTPAGTRVCLEWSHVDAAQGAVTSRTGHRPHGLGSFTTCTKNSSICRTALMNWSRSTGLVTYALACSL